MPDNKKFIAKYTYMRYNKFTMFNERNNIMNLLKSLAILTAKSAILLGKFLGKKGSSAPGSLAMKIYPDILRELSQQIGDKIICVCGTNGKTTSTNLIYSMLTNSGKKVVCNNVGANMLPGIACSFIKDASISGKLRADYAVLECDEASLRHIANHIKIDTVLVTNLFRDQLDRYGEIELTAGLLDEAFSKISGVKLILNADDPISSYFGKKYSATYYGINYHNNKKDDEVKEGKYCPECKGELIYSDHYYSQMGIYKCSDCDFLRKSPDYLADNVDMTEGLKFDISYRKNKQTIDVKYKGFYNIYNILGAFSVFENLGLGTEVINSTLSSYKPQIGRMESFLINGKKVILNLAKNPAGFNQALETLMNDSNEKDVYIAVNDMPSDGTDVSWIWDVEFEKLNSSNADIIYAGGNRMDELALCMNYCGCSIDRVSPVNKKSLKEFVSLSDRTAYILVNYTILFDTQKILKKLEKGGK